MCEPRPDACLDVEEPVCGCDGMTYSNECYANSAGVDIANSGECPVACQSDSDCGRGETCSNGVCVPNNGDVICGARAGDTCQDDEFCNFPDIAMCGATDQSGVCEARPQICPDVIDPVCGCDFMTYNNACEAQGAGTDVLYDGACDGTCILDSDCDMGEACINGVCEERTTGICGGLAGFTCAPDEWCDYPDLSMCGAADQTGTCQPRPQACIDLYDPVCGCDGMTYSNSCYANGAGVDVASDGACTVACSNNSDCQQGESCVNGSCEPKQGVCGGLLGLQCAADEYCDYPDASMCGQGDVQGDCKSRPQACPQVYMPVCGCDNMTHSNSCMARSAGVDVLYDGPCSNN